MINFINCENTNLTFQEKDDSKLLSPMLTSMGINTIGTQTSLIVSLALFPYFIILFTGFMKIVIVLSLLRNALGVQQTPPNQVLNGMAAILSIFIMFPTLSNVWEDAQTNTKIMIEETNNEYTAYDIWNLVTISTTSLKNFFINNSLKEHREMFFNFFNKISKEKNVVIAHNSEEITCLLPAYITSQLKESFEIGVLIYGPFFVIDMITANILLAMGMMMLSPVTISTPLKLLLIVSTDGWTILINSLMHSFQI